MKRGRGRSRSWANLGRCRGRGPRRPTSSARPFDGTSGGRGNTRDATGVRWLGSGGPARHTGRWSVPGSAASLTTRPSWAAAATSTTTISSPCCRLVETRMACPTGHREFGSHRGTRLCSYGSLECPSRSGISGARRGSCRAFEGLRSLEFPVADLVTLNRIRRHGYRRAGCLRRCAR